LYTDGETLYLGTKKGLASTKDLTNFVYYDLKNGIDECEIKCITKDNNGLLWVGTLSNGIYKMITSDISRYEFDNEPLSFAFDKNKKLFALTNKAILKYEELSDNFVIYKELKGIDGPNNFCFDNDNNIYVTNEGNGFVKISGNKITPIVNYKRVNSPGNYALSLGSSSSYVWLCFRQRILRIDQYTQKVDTFKREKLNSGYFQDVDALDGMAIVSSDRGLLIFNGLKFDSITTNNCKGYPDGITNCLTKDKYGHIWVGSDRGLFCFENGKAYSNLRKDFFPTNEIADIADIDSFLLVATGKGLIQVSIKPEKNQNCVYKIINQRNGLNHVDLTNRRLISDGKNIWITSSKGIYRYKPTLSKLFNIPLYISNISNDSTSLVFARSKNFIKRTVDVSKPLNLKYDQNDFVIEFNGINYHLFENVFYSYRLIGLNDNWSIPSNENKAVFTNLSHGDYIFELSLSNGKHNFGKVISYIIKISPPFYKTWWFRALSMVSLLLLVLWFIQYRIKRIKQKNILLEKKVMMRTKELQEKSNELKNSNDQLAFKNSLITESLEYAKNIQESILPTEQFMKSNFDQLFHVETIYKPKDIVGGDFYSAFKKGDFSYFALIDCTGHGVPGALLTFSVYSLLHNIIDISSETYKPSEILHRLLNDFFQVYVKGKNVNESFAISLIRVNNITKELLASSISQSIAIIKNNELVEVKSTTSFYLENKNAISDAVFQLTKGDRIYLYSDGYYDQKHHQSNKRMFKSNFFKLLENSISMDLNKQTFFVLNSFQEFKGNSSQVDDVSVLLVEVC
jgi:serine phosphatase RsbU (regulator of sigma subunit)